MRSTSRFLFLCFLCLVTRHAFAQEQGGMQMPMPEGHQHTMPMPDSPLGIGHTREASGTSWLPDTSPMMGPMHSKGRWTLMVHGTAFLQFIKTGSQRGDEQFGSLNWVMGTAQRNVGGGQLVFRSMLTLEPLTVGRCGYPSLVQSGEFCRGQALHDRQHPHDLFMELAAGYKRAINDSVAFEIYGGPSGEPALGPTAFMHRLSALPNPIAPISHHWLDSTHISFGVVTGGLYGRKWKAEASVFNGREPDDKRYGFDFAPMDSYSGRLLLMPAPSWVLQVSAGHLADAEGPGEDVRKVTASATYHRLVNNRIWATTVAWGLNREGHHSASALTAETAADITARDTVFARGEVTQKTSHDLVLPLSDDSPRALTKLQAGYTRWIAEGRGMKAGVGMSGGVSMIPKEFEPFYGTRTAGEFGVYFTVR